MVLPRVRQSLEEAAGPAVWQLQPPKLKLKSSREHAGHLETGREERGKRQGSAEEEKQTKRSFEGEKVGQNRTNCRERQWIAPKAKILRSFAACLYFTQTCLIHIFTHPPIFTETCSKFSPIRVSLNGLVQLGLV